MASKRLSKLVVQFHFICRHTALTSIQSSNYLPSSKPCCGRSLPIPSRTPLSPSTACARPSPLVSARSLGLSVQHSSPTQDMVNLTGKRSNHSARTTCSNESQSVLPHSWQRCSPRLRALRHLMTH